MKWFSLLWLSSAILSCERNQPPTCTIITPENGTEFEIGEMVTISVFPDDSDGSISEVRFCIDGMDVGSSDSYPYSQHWYTSDAETGNHTIGATVKDDGGASATDEIVVLMIEARIAGPVTDVDGNVYKTVKIGTQWWMAENLKAIHYADGTAIPLVESDSAWNTLSVSDKAYCWSYNRERHCDIYGGLYTWAAAMNGTTSSHSDPSGVQGVCPDGWHLPSDEEWKELEMSLGMSRTTADKRGWRGTNEGGKLKETYQMHWLSPNTGATNESGFTALPGGNRDQDGFFVSIKNEGHWWSSSEYDTGLAWSRCLYSSREDVARYYNHEDGGFSVRCVWD